MKSARFIVVYENSGEVANVVTIADADEWPPPFMSEALRRARQQQQERERSDAAD